MIDQRENDRLFAAWMTGAFLAGAGCAVIAFIVLRAISGAGC